MRIHLIGWLVLAAMTPGVCRAQSESPKKVLFLTHAATPPERVRWLSL